MTQEPLIYTIKGNLPVASLLQQVEWRVDQDKVIFVERYYLGEELVKESSHVKLLCGVAAEGAASL